MIGIICPSLDEMDPIRNSMIISSIYKHALLSIHEGTIFDKNIVLLFSGVCKVNAAIAAQSIIDKYSLDLIILSGVAGSIDKNIHIFDTIIATEIAHHDVASNILTEYHPWMQSIWYKQDVMLIEKCKNLENTKKLYYGKIISGECFIHENEKEILHEQFEAMAVDMESASIAQVCYANNIPLLTIRTITDRCDENGIDNFEKNVKRCSEISGKVVLEFIKNFS